MESVTPRQLEILQLIRDYRNRFGYSPTMQEIGDQLGLTKVTVFEHVRALVKKRLLIRGAKHKARSLRVSPQAEFPDEKPSRLPIAGRIAAGSPIEAIEDRRQLDLEDLFANPDSFVLEVTGDSMIEDHIAEGDYVVCERRNTARNGETVVALLPDGEATLKRLYREKGRIRLQPANANYEPILVDDVQIQGVVIGVIRKL
ncbi:MAG: transcriptional repressor LexA, partial [Phycisphaerae bacterium]